MINCINFSAKLSQFFPSRQRCVWSDIVMMEDIWSILIAFPESIALVIDSRDQNQLFCLAVAAHSERFPSNPTKYTALPSSTSIFVIVPHFASNTIFFRTLLSLSTFHHIINLFKNSTILFHFSNSQMEIQSEIKFFSVKSLKHQASLCIQLYIMLRNLFLWSMFSSLAIS